MPFHAKEPAATGDCVEAEHMPNEYYEEEPQLRIGGLLGGAWKRLLVDHLRDCARQRRVFRESLNNMRSEVLTETARMHNENQSKMVELSDRLAQGQDKIENLQRWIFGGVITTLVGMLVYFVTHFGPLSGH